MSKPKSLVVLSGGQDSVTTLYAAARETEVVGAVHFRYGQKHAIERECAEFHIELMMLAENRRIEFFEIDVPAFEQIGHSALLKNGGDVCESHPTLSHLPASFVPGRNLIFLTLAAAQAMKIGATQIWTGVCQEDYSGYPDCRKGAVLTLESAIRQGMDFPDLEIKTPLMYLTKAQTFALAEELGVLSDIIQFTHTCYNGVREELHEWGYGCGECPACQVRKAGWEQFKREKEGADAS